MQALTVVGAGKVGRTLARLWHESGTFRIHDVVCRTRSAAESAVAFIGAGRPLTDWRSVPTADLLLIAVPDDAIADSASRIAQDTGTLSGCTAWHCSGALAASELAPLAARGARVAAAHPVHSFADPVRSVEQFAGSWCALDGDAAAVERLAAAFAAIGARTVVVDSATKLLYHAAGVFASNYLVALLDRAVGLAMGSGLAREQALRLLEPLVRATVDNLFAVDAAQALTGPIARGDAGLVGRQHAFVSRWDPATGELYRALGDAALAVAERRGTLDRTQLTALAEALLTDAPD